MKRWLCRLRGHRIRTQTRSWWVWPARDRRACDVVVERRRGCWCNPGEWEKAHRYGLDHITLPVYDHDRLHATGRLRRS